MQSGSLVLDEKSSGPWLDAVKVVNEFEKRLNHKISDYNTKYGFSIRGFTACGDHPDYNSVVSSIYQDISNEHNDYDTSLSEIKQSIESEVRRFQFDLSRLQLHIVAAAFCGSDGIPLLDLFSRRYPDGSMAERSHVEFANIMSGKSFLAFFYKV
jgi:hypothetical protein